MLGAESIKKLSAAKVIVLGLGGVGSYVAEALCRSGIGHLFLVDCDAFEESNINRQLFAVRSTIGASKCEVARARLLDINPDADVRYLDLRLTVDNLHRLPLVEYDYVVDAIDAVDVKVALADVSYDAGIKLITACGAGFRINGDMLRVGELKDTSVCPIARILRRELKESHQPYKVVFSIEKPIKPTADCREKVASAVFVPALMGFTLAEEVVKDIIEN